MNILQQDSYSQHKQCKNHKIKTGIFMHQFKIYTYIASKKKAHFHDSSYVKQVSSLQVLPHLSVHPCAAGDLLFCSSLAVSDQRYCSIQYLWSDKNRFSGQWSHVVVESRTGPSRYRARLQ